MNIQNVRLLGVAAAATIALAGCATPPGYSSAPAPSYGGSSYGGNSTCYDCGTVTRIEQVTTGSSAPSATGAVLGGIVGAVAGHEISRHTGGSEGHQNVAAAAGAVGGAIAGKVIPGVSTTEGAVAGAVLGGVLGAVINGRQYYRDTRGYCYYVDQYGRPIYDYNARC